MHYIPVKAMAGVNYVRAQDILAVQYTDREKCALLLSGGISMPCYEPAATVVARIEEHIKGAHAAPDRKEPRDGDGSA